MLIGIDTSDIDIIGIGTITIAAIIVDDIGIDTITITIAIITNATATYDARAMLSYCKH